MSLDRLDRYWAETDWDGATLLDADRLVVLELAGGDDRGHRNVLTDDDDGREWLSVEKTATGTPGATRLVSYEAEPPFADVV